MLTRFFLALFILLAGQLLPAQSPFYEPYDFTVENVGIPEALTQLTEISGIDIAFSSKIFDPEARISLDLKDTPHNVILGRILAGQQVGHKYSGQKIVLFRKKELKLELSGFLKDHETGEAVVAASVYCPALQVGTLTNEYGFFSLALPQGEHSIHISSLGYLPVKFTDKMNHNHGLTIALIPNDLTLAEVVIQPDDSLSASPPIDPQRILEIDRKTLSAVPPLAGEEDLVRASHLLPGVQAGADGTAGLFVRGGDAGHNLMLLDGVPVYIPFHLIGMYSVYNSSTVKSARLLKGGFSARYGGRLASVLDVRTREGNENKFQAEASANLINGRLTLEAPLKGIQSAMLVSGRISPTAALFRPFFDSTYFRLPGGQMETNFSDLLFKFNRTFSRRDRLYATFFFSNDQFGKEYGEEGAEGTDDMETEVYWGNLTAALRWNHLYNYKLFSNTSVTFSRFNYKYAALDRFTSPDSTLPDEVYYVDNRSLNHELGLVSDFDYFHSDHHTLRFGLGASLRNFNPNLSYLDQESSELDSLEVTGLASFEELVEINERQALEGFLYLEDRIRFGSRLLLNPGLRGSAFLHESGNHFRAEPRLSIHYQPLPALTVFASGSRMVQYLHLISNTAIRFPNDLWLPSSEGILPSSAWQAELGADLQLSSGLKLSLEAYSKSMENLYAVPDGFDFLDSINLDVPGSFLLQGSGTATGLETSLSFQGTRFYGMVSHALTRTTRTFAGQNQGQEFPQDYDRRHQFKVFALQQLGKRFQLSGSWVYFSPAPTLNLVSIDRGLGLTNAAAYPPGEKNLARSAPYHRLDLSLSYQIPGQRFNHRFRFGAFNVYNRRNVTYSRRDALSGNTAPVYAIPFTPSVSYSLNF